MARRSAQRPAHRPGSHRLLGPGRCSGLQRAAGNAAVADLVRRPSRATAVAIQREVSNVQAAPRGTLHCGDGPAGDGRGGHLRRLVRPDAQATSTRSGPRTGGCRCTELDADLADELTESELAHVRRLLATAPRTPRPATTRSSGPARVTGPGRRHASSRRRCRTGAPRRPAGQRPRRPRGLRDRGDRSRVPGPHRARAPGRPPRRALERETGAGDGAPALMLAEGEGPAARSG